MSLHGEPHVLVHGEVGEQVGELEGAADAALGPPPPLRASSLSTPSSSTSPALAGSCPEIRLK
jgi:hypothetical protein